jgi:hypothetical protein
MTHVKSRGREKLQLTQLLQVLEEGPDGSCLRLGQYFLRIPFVSRKRDQDLITQIVEDTWYYQLAGHMTSCSESKDIDLRSPAMISGMSLIRLSPIFLPISPVHPSSTFHGSSTSALYRLQVVPRGLDVQSPAEAPWPGLTADEIENAAKSASRRYFRSLPTRRGSSLV